MNTPTELRAALSADLEELQRRELYRYRHVISVDDHDGVHGIIDGKRVQCFCSNDYLGLKNHPRVRQAFIRAAERHGVGSGSAHLITGHSTEHHALEEEIASFLGRERALLFSTGYMANLGLATSLARRGDEIFEDKLNHASLIDAARLSGARTRRYAHSDMAALGRRMDNAGGRHNFILSDGVFSMDGDVADLPELVSLAQKHGATLIIDDAHGIGVLGHNGRGTVDHYALKSSDVPVLMGTLGKALGCFGAFVAGESVFIETLVQKARSYIYTTAPPAAIAAAARTALRLIDDEAWRRDHLNTLVMHFRKGAQTLGVKLSSSNTAIQPLLLGDAATALAASEALFQHGFLVSAIRPPTVPVGGSRLRITLSAAHNENQVDQLLNALNSILPRVAA